MTLRELTVHLRGLRGVRHKLDIQSVGALLRPSAGGVVAVGDDCAAISDSEGYLLLAIEGLVDEFVSAEPWFAGYCAVMVNVSDIYAMGGRPMAVVDALWSAGADRAGPVWDGMKTAAAKYAVPIVGGHTNSRSAADHLAAAILGRATRLLTSFDARPGDALLAAIDLRGEWFGTYPWWNASTLADGDRLRADLEILPALAEAGLCAAAKDISMAGLVGTAAMLAECSGIGINIDVSAVPMPASLALVQAAASATSVVTSPAIGCPTSVFCDERVISIPRAVNPKEGEGGLTEAAIGPSSGVRCDLSPSPGTPAFGSEAQARRGEGWGESLSSGAQQNEDPHPTLSRSTGRGNSWAAQQNNDGRPLQDNREKIADTCDGELTLAKWLSAFPSYGFLLAVSPHNVAEVSSRFAERGIAVATIGSCDSSNRVTLTDGSGASEVFWDMNREPFIGFGPGRPREQMP